MVYDVIGIRISGLVPDGRRSRLWMLAVAWSTCYSWLLGSPCPASGEEFQISSITGDKGR